MRNFSEYLEEKEAEEILSEGFTDIIAKILGIGTQGVLYAWIASLLVKGGIGVGKSFTKSFSKENLAAFKSFRKEAASSPAVQNQIRKEEERKNKYEEEQSLLVQAIRSKDWDKAREEFHNLPLEKQNSTEFRKFVIEEIVKTCGAIITAQPTPGSATFIGIRRTIDLPTAKTMAMAFEKEVAQMSVSEK